MSLHKPKGVSLLKRSDGNIILFDSKLRERYKNNLATLLQDKILTENEAQAIKHITVQPLHPDRDFITYGEIERALECKRDSVVKRFLSLKKKGFVSFENFDRSEASGESLARCNMVVLRPVAELSDAILERISEQDNSKNKAQRMSKNALRERILKENGLPIDAYIKPDDLTSALMPKGFGLFERIAVDAGVRAKSSVTTFKQGGLETAVETLSIDDIFTIEDIQPLYCLVSITILSWYNCIEYFEAKQILPPNRLYCEIYQIMKMLGKSGSGSYYPSIQASMARILGTEYKIITGEQIFEEKLGVVRKPMELYKFFDPLKTKWHTKDKITIEFDERLGSERLKVDAYGYELTWEKDLYHTLLSEEAFFNIPISILSARPIVFLLYVNLRNRMASVRNEHIFFSIEELFNILIASRGKTETKLSSFKESLFTDLKIYKSKNCYKDANLEKDTDNIAHFDLAGYIITVDHSERRIKALSVSLQHARMLKLSGVACTDDGKSIKEPKRRAAPQSVNKVLDTVKRVATKLQKLGSDNISPDLTYRLAKIQIPKPRKSYGKLIYSLKDVVNSQIELSAYSSDNEIAQLADAIIQNGDELKSGLLHTRLKTKIKTLPLLKIESNSAVVELEISQFNDIITTLSEDRQFIVQTIELYETLRKNITLRETAITKWTTKRNKNALIDKLVDTLNPQANFDLEHANGAIYENQ